MEAVELQDIIVNPAVRDVFDVQHFNFIPHAAFL